MAKRQVPLSTISTVRKKLSSKVIASAIVAVSALTLVAAAVGVPAAAVTSTAANRCPEIILYFSRGSGQAIGPSEPRGDERGLANPGLQLYGALVARYGSASVASIANGYPAVPIKWRLVRTARLYGPSVANGRRALERNIADLVRVCPRSELILGGFSQGAEATHSALSELGEREQQHVAAVVLFGDPLFRPGEPGVNAEASVDKGLHFDPEENGIRNFLVTVKPLAASFAGKVFSWCHRSDLVCQGLHLGNGFKTHKTYADEIPTAMTRIAERLLSLTNAYRVADTCHNGTCGLAERSGPGMTNFKAVGALYDGQEVNVACQAMGQSVSGAGGGASAVWDRLSNGAFVPDYYVDTPNFAVYSPRIPHCDALAVAEP